MRSRRPRGVYATNGIRNGRQTEELWGFYDVAEQQPYLGNKTTSGAQGHTIASTPSPNAL